MVSNRFLHKVGADSLVIATARLQDTMRDINAGKKMYASIPTDPSAIYRSQNLSRLAERAHISETNPAHPKRRVLHATFGFN